MVRARIVLMGFVAMQIVGATSFAAERDKEPYCRWEVSGERLSASDAWLYDPEDFEDPRTHAAVAEHLPSGYPSGIGNKASGEILLAQPHFIVWYDTDLKSPLWTAHHLTRHEAAAHPKEGEPAGEYAAERRKSSYRSDPRLEPGAKSECADYVEPIFDQGHMVPNSDVDFITPGMNISLGMDHSFLMSNMTPQHCAFNRGPWMVLENLVRHWATETHNLWVVTGAIFDRDGVTGRDLDDDAWRMAGKRGRRVAIPSAQYKIVARWERGQWETLTVVIPNTDQLVEADEMIDFLSQDIQSLDDINRATGLRFFVDAEVNERKMFWSTPKGIRWMQPFTGKCKSPNPDMETLLSGYLD